MMFMIDNITGSFFLMFYSYSEQRDKTKMTFEG